MTDARGMIAIRCGNRKHFDVAAGSVGVARIYCRDKRCGASRAVIVMHEFDLTTGELTNTYRFSRWQQPHVAATQESAGSAVPMMGGIA